MTSTALITGTSTGIGRATAKHFAANGWNVVATMRAPEAESGRDDPLTDVEGVLVTRLDVTDLASIDAAVALGTKHFGAIDALVNNAGYGAYGALESTPREKIVRQFDTNVIGLFDVTKALLPQMRTRGSGVIVNVSSMGGKITMPLGSLYHGTKFAVEGLSEALSFELGAIGVKMKIVEPGIVTTDFSGRSMDLSVDPELSEYAPVVQGLIAASQADRPASSPESVAEIIFGAATDGTDQLRYVAGEDAAQIIAARSAADDATFLAQMRTTYGLA
ncbi:MAG: SDR family oxidoreductase [Actinomycetota bacterium]